MMWEDPIVTEVRSIRQAHAEKFGFDLRSIYQDVKQQEQEGNHTVVSFPPRSPLPVQTAKLLGHVQT